MYTVVDMPNGGNDASMTTHRDNGSYHCGDCEQIPLCCNDNNDPRTSTEQRRSSTSPRLHRLHHRPLLPLSKRPQEFATGSANFSTQFSLFTWSINSLVTASALLIITVSSSHTANTMAILGSVFGEIADSALIIGACCFSYLSGENGKCCLQTWAVVALA